MSTGAIDLRGGNGGNGAYGGGGGRATDLFIVGGTVTLADLLSGGGAGGSPDGASGPSGSLFAGAESGDLNLDFAGNKFAYMVGIAASGNLTMRNSEHSAFAAGIAYYGSVTYNSTGYGGEVVMYGGGPVSVTAHTDQYNPLIIQQAKSNEASVSILADYVTSYYGSVVSAATYAQWSPKTPSLPIGVNQSFFDMFDGSTPLLRLGGMGGYSGNIVLVDGIVLANDALSLLTNGGQIYSVNGGITVNKLNLSGGSVNMSIVPGLNVNNVGTLQGSASAGDFYFNNADTLVVASADSGSPSGASASGVLCIRIGASDCAPTGPSNPVSDLIKQPGLLTTIDQVIISVQKSDDNPVQGEDEDAKRRRQAAKDIGICSGSQG